MPARVGRISEYIRKDLLRADALSDLDFVTPRWVFRLFARVTRPELDSSCWIWTGSTTNDGYGSVHYRTDRRQGSIRAHRAVWLLSGRVIPSGMELHHRCSVRSCVNPSHIDVVTPRQNVMQAASSIPVANARKTVCKRGHKFEWRKVRHHGALRYARKCRVCQNKHNAAYRLRKKLAHA